MENNIYNYELFILYDVHWDLTEEWYGPHELKLIKYSGNFKESSVSLIKYDIFKMTTLDKLDYSLDETCNISSFGYYFRLMVEKIIAIFNEDERSFMSCYNIYEMAKEYINKCYFLNNITLLSFSYLLDYRYERKINHGKII